MVETIQKFDEFVPTTTTNEISKLSKTIQEEKGKPENIYLNPSDDDDDDYQPDTDTDSDDDSIHEVINDIQHKMYNDNQKLHKKLTRLELENTKLEKKLHYLQLSHNNERVEKISALENVVKHKRYITTLSEKNKKLQKYLLIGGTVHTAYIFYMFLYLYRHTFAYLI